MIGTNRIMLNEATMKAALQEYFDKRYTEGIQPGPRVTQVQYIHDPTGTCNFTIQLEGRNP